MRKKQKEKTPINSIDDLYFTQGYFDIYTPTYKSNINIHMKDFFGSSKINNQSKHIYLVHEITPDVIDKFFTYLSVDCKLKNTSIKHFRNQI